MKAYVNSLILRRRWPTASRPLYAIQLHTEVNRGTYRLHNEYFSVFIVLLVFAKPGRHPGNKKKKGRIVYFR